MHAVQIRTPGNYTPEALHANAISSGDSRCGFFTQGCSAVRRARRDAPWGFQG